mgnify:CR=1 FL=1
MIMDKKEEMLREAVHQHYQCNGEYACEERAYCRFCDGENIAHDCDEDCFADEFSEGFLSGWDACLKYLGDIPWDEAMKEVIDSKGGQLNKKQPVIIESKLQVADKVYPMSFEQNRLELHNLEVRTKVSQ